MTTVSFFTHGKVNGQYTSHWDVRDEPSVKFTINLEGRGLERPLEADDAIREGFKVLLDELSYLELDK